MGPPSAMKMLERLSQLETLRLPGQMTRGDAPATASARLAYLEGLLASNPGVFLERHGDNLLPSELAAHFGPVRCTNFEVDYYLEHQERQRQSSGAAPRRLSTVAKNRRLAKMLLLIEEGSYFSDEAMREREPYLYHAYVGQYRASEEEGPEGSAAEAGAGGDPEMPLMARSILRQQDELALLLRREAERQQYAAMALEQESESEREEEAEEEEGKESVDTQDKKIINGGSASEKQDAMIPGEWPAPEPITEEERVENARAFLDNMKLKFLAGEDKGIDYARIDADTELDEHFAAEERQDAEDEYFDDVAP